MIKSREMSSEEKRSSALRRYGCTPDELEQLHRQDEKDELKQLKYEVQSLLEHFTELEEELESETRDSTKLKSLKGAIQERVIHIFEGSDTFFSTHIRVDEFSGLDYGAEEDIKFMKKDWRLKIIFPYLLRSKNKRTNDWKKLYSKRFNEFFTPERRKKYPCPAAICFVHCFRPTQRFIDLDNFAIKGVVDLIVSSCLFDDSPECLPVIVLTWKYSVTPHTEVSVMPESELNEFYEEIKERRDRFLRAWKKRNSKRKCDIRVNTSDTTKRVVN